MSLIFLPERNVPRFVYFDRVIRVLLTLIGVLLTRLVE